MKKLLTYSIIALFATCVAFAGVYEVKGESAKATPFEIVLVALVAVPALVPQKNLSLGFTRSAYFDKNSEPYTRAELELIRFLENAKPGTIKDLKDGNLVLDSYSASLKFTIPISITGTRDLLTGATQYAEGRIPEEFNYGILPQGFNIAVSHILIGYATDASVTVPEGDVDFTNVTDSWPAALRNGTTRIFQSGSLKKKFANVLAGTKAAGNSNNGIIGLEFQCPFIIEEVKQTKIDLVTPTAVAFPATPAGLFLEYVLVGACTRQRS